MATLHNSPYFYALASVAGVVFLLGVGGNVAFWLSGSRAPSKATGSHVHGKEPGSIISGVVVNGLFQKRLFLENKLRWLMSMSFLWGAIELFFVGSLGDALREDFGVSGLTFDTPWFASLNEVGGLLILFGVLIALYRRFVVRAPNLKSAWDDGLIVGSLALIVLSGYFLEATRLLAAPGAGANYSFVGHGISRLLQHAGTSWGSVHSYLWWLHAFVSLSFVAYIPFSKLFHMFAAPLAMMTRSKKERMAERSLKGVSDGA